MNKARPGPGQPPLPQVTTLRSNIASRLCSGRALSCGTISMKLAPEMPLKTLSEISAYSLYCPSQTLPFLSPLWNFRTAPQLPLELWILLFDITQNRQAEIRTVSAPLQPGELP